MGAGRGTLSNIKQAEAQERCLAQLALGATISEAMASANRQRPTFYLWCAASPKFKAQAEKLIANRADLKQYNFIDARKRYFAMETYWHQRKIVEAIEDSPPGSKIMILLPPEAGKTTLIEDFCNLRLGEFPNTRIGMICENKQLAQERVGRIAARMTTPELFGAYIQKFGPFKVKGRDMAKPWNSERLTVEKAKHDERDPSLEAKGAGTAIYGKRWDYVIIDDIQSTNNLLATPKLLSFYRQDIITRVSKQGKIIIIGTRVGPGDFYSELLRLDLIDYYVNIPALNDFGESYWPPVYNTDGTRRRSPNGDALGWSVTELAKRKKEVGDEVWARTYMQQSSSRSGQAFEDRYIEDAKDYKRTIQTACDMPGRILGIDPALVRFAGFIVGIYDSKTLIIADGESIEGLMNYDAIFDTVEHYARKWKPNKVIFEANNIQRGLARDSRVLALKEMYGFEIHEHTTSFNKYDEKIGIAAMASAFRRGEIKIAFGDEETQTKLGQLISELKAWRPDIPSRQLRQDMVMSMWFVYLQWINMKAYLEQSGEGFSRPGLTGFTPLQAYYSIGARSG